MARFLSFLGLSVVAYIGMSNLDSLFLFMSERREALNAEERLQRESLKLRDELLKEAKQKAAE